MENNYKMDQNGNITNPTAPAQTTPVQNVPAPVPVPAPVTPEPWYVRLAKSKVARTTLKVIGVGGALVGAFFLGKNSGGNDSETETVDHVVDDQQNAE